MTPTNPALQRTVALLKAQQEAAIDGILVVDENRKVVSFNRRFLKVWELPVELVDAADDRSVIQAVLDTLVAPAAFIERVEHLYEHPLERSQDELVLKDGRIIDRYSGPVVSDEGEYFGRIWFFRDITAQRKAEQEARAISQLGQYLLEEKIGEGGMGIVYRASHALLRRPTAVKLLPLERSNETTLRRFEREVRLTSQLTHPNTIIVFDYGRASSGAFYYAMEYLEGIDLAQLVEQYGPQPPGRVIRILAQAAAALAEAHARGLIHRDIKPANVMLTERVQAPDFVKVLDFGLVKMLDATVRDHKSLEAKLTEERTISGTPRFMAPEAIRSPDAIDARSDIYALGALGYFLLTGKPVFDTRSVALLLAEVLSSPPMTPSKRLGTPVPDDLERIVLACLAKSPKDRPASAIDLRKALLACESASTYEDHHAAAWWAEHRARSHVPEVSAPPSTRSLASETVVGIDLKQRSPEAD